MINTPKELSDIEVGLYKSGYGFCEKLWMIIILQLSMD